MKALLNEQGFITSYALVGELTDGIELPMPEDIPHFEEHFTAYRVRAALPSLTPNRMKHFKPKQRSPNCDFCGKRSAFLLLTVVSFGMRVFPSPNCWSCANGIKRGLRSRKQWSCRRNRHG